MATGFDGLLDFLLSAIALSGVQGAGSEDFRRFIHSYYEESRVAQQNYSEQAGPAQSPTSISRSFQEKVWEWVNSHSDIQILYGGEARDFSLQEFEALEAPATGVNVSGDSIRRQGETSANALATPKGGAQRPSDILLSLRDSLRHRLTDEDCHIVKTPGPKFSAGASSVVQSADPCQSLHNESVANPILPDGALQPTKPSEVEKSVIEPVDSSLGQDLVLSDEVSIEAERTDGQKLRGPRRQPKSIRVTGPVFDEPPLSVTAPRLFASQNRVWQAVTGHSLDLKKVPSMEFVLLCVIATHGRSGISQPDLVKITGQDKRSVPKRTDELARKGYIDKKPIQDGSLRTSLCVHKKFVQEGHFLNQPQGVDDVFGASTFILSGFVHLLHKLLMEVDVVPMRELRTKMGVSVEKWNKRAVRQAIARLDQTGFVKRVRARKKGTLSRWLICVKLLREPVDEDFKQLRWRRINAEPEQITEELFDDNLEGDAFMRDMELAMVDDVDAESGDERETVDRVPPQWTPDRMLANTVLSAVELAGPDGGDMSFLRERTIGKFWKRPLESFVSRLTDDWEKSQPRQIRHLSIVRDTWLSQEKKFSHYIYRTHSNYQKAVDAGETRWDAVSKEALDLPQAIISGAENDIQKEALLDAWGFLPLDVDDFHRRTGSSTLADARSAIVHGRRYGQHWDNALIKKTGYRKPKQSTVGRIPGQTAKPAAATRDHLTSPGSKRGKKKVQEVRPKRRPSIADTRSSTSRATSSQGSLSLAQIDTTTVEKGKPDGPRIPLLSMEQRVALGLPRKGRLGMHIENQIREHRQKTGDSASLPDVIANVPGKSTSGRRRKEQRLPKGDMIAWGLPETGRSRNAVDAEARKEKDIVSDPKSARRLVEQQTPKEAPLLTKDQRIARGLPPTGRLPNSLIEDLRRQRAVVPSFNTSPTLKSSELLGADEVIVSTEDTDRPPLGQTRSALSPVEQTNVLFPPSMLVPRKRAADIGVEEHEHTSKRIHFELDAPGQESVSHTAAPLSSLLDTPVSTKRNLKSLDSNAVHMTQRPPMSSRVPSSSERRPGLASGPLLSSSQVIASVEDRVDTNPPTSGRKYKARRSTVLDETPPQLLSDAELSAQQTISNMSGSGVYFHPLATRSMGRGRPRKAFIAIFRCMGLRDLDWFVPDQILYGRVLLPAPIPIAPELERRQFVSSLGITPDRAPSPVAPVEADSQPSPVKTRITGAAAPLGGTHPTETSPAEPSPTKPSIPEPYLSESSQAESSQAEPSQAEPSQVEPSQVEPSQVEPSQVEPSQVEPLRAELSSKIQSPAELLPMGRLPTEPFPTQRLSGPMTEPRQHIDAILDNGASMESSVPTTSNQEMLESSISIIGHTDTRRMPMGWNAINAPSKELSPVYQSPYGPVTPAQSLPQSPAPHEANSTSAKHTSESTAHKAVSAGVHETSVTLDDPIVTSPQPYETPKAVGNRSVVRGRGALLGTRTSVIRHILELCNGVFPMNAEIVPVVEQIWKDLAPKKMACPERGTIVSTLKNMTEDPRHNLKSLTYHLKAIEGGGRVKKKIVAYKHLPVNGPEILRVRDGIIGAYPYRYWPPEVRHYVKEEQEPKPRFVPEFDDTISLDPYGPIRKKLDERIKASKQSRSEAQQVRRQRERERKEQNKAIEETHTTDGEGPKVLQVKRARLETLNEKNKPKQDNIQQSTREPKDGEANRSRERSLALSGSPDDVPLTGIRSRRPLVMGQPRSGFESFNSFPITDSVLLEEDTAVNNQSSSEDRDSERSEEDSSDDQSSTEQSSPDDPKLPASEDRASTQIVDGTNGTELGSLSGGELSLVQTLINLGLSGVEAGLAALMTPTTRFNPHNGTFSTDFKSVKEKSDIIAGSPAAAIAASDPSHILKRGAKRVRHTSAHAQRPPKRVRVSHSKLATATNMQHRFSRDAAPTLIERLTGLTGDPNEPDYQPPSKKHKKERTWQERREKERARVRLPRVKKYKEHPDPVNRFKKLCFTLIVASSMSGEDGVVDWSIVMKVYHGNRRFDLTKTQKIWLWMQSNMTAQLSKLTETFQSDFLEAYEQGQLASIDNPATYDWANLVRWALHECRYPDPPLPATRESLNSYTFDTSDHDIFNRPSWYKDTEAYVGRAQRLLQYAYVSPFRQAESQAEDQALKARSWIRANISTPQPLYDKKSAHDKLKILGEPVLERVVSNLVQASFLRMWKIKRLRPGRNYDFTAKFAQKFRRQFEPKNFMAAVKLKKDLDTAFGNESLDKRTCSLSRKAEDGAVMAIMSLISDGRIKLVPRLPPINSDFTASQPRISAWGFCEGSYVHRDVPRERLFWQLDAVPTKNYEFGNPLQPQLVPLPLKQDGSQADWSALPEPPLPGRHSSDALLPIWSSIDGRVITWPWWNRILNIVIQCLMFQPGSTAIDVFNQCPEHAVEVFEIELVLDWLEAVKAAKKTPRGTYQALPGFWAVFGDRLIDDDNDKFGKHVDRKGRIKTMEQTWRDEYNLKYSALQRAKRVPRNDSADENDVDSASEDELSDVQEQIFQDRRKQYAITKKALKASERGRPPGSVRNVPASEPPLQDGHAESEPRVGPTLVTAQQNQDVVVVDTDLDADGEDVDAEGESDDDYE